MPAADMKRSTPSPSRPPARRRRREEYPVRRILAESESQYEIDWAPDEETGEAYQPSWEHKDDVSFDLRLDWELAKLAARESAQQRILQSEGGRCQVQFAATAWVDEDRVDQKLLDGWRLERPTAPGDGDGSDTAAVPEEAPEQTAMRQLRERQRKREADTAAGAGPQPPVSKANSPQAE